MTIAVLYLPFLQTHFASQNRFGAMFELRAVRRVFARAPIAFFVAIFVTLLFALPLYLLKIEITPREAEPKIVRQGRLSAGFVGVRKAARVGRIVLGVWLLLWPLRFISSLLTSSMIIDPESDATRNLTVWLIVLSTVLDDNNFGQSGTTTPSPTQIDAVAHVQFRRRGGIIRVVEER